MEKQQASTGASNLEYDVIAEMHCLLKGNSALEQYIEDARSAGDKEAESCFKAIYNQNKENVNKLRPLLTQRLSKAA
jgi:hypothetical protein